MWAMNAKVALHLASALAYLHDRRIIPRDVKSRNVLLNATFGAKLADFGVATTIKQQRERTWQLVRTYRWIAPEVLRQQPASPASDVYSFGVVLFELDTHKTPFDDHGDADEMAQRILNGDLTLEFSPACPRWVHDMAVHCMSEHLELRPKAHDLVQMIQESLHRKVLTFARMHHRILPMQTPMNSRRLHAPSYAMDSLQLFVALLLQEDAMQGPAECSPGSSSKLVVLT
ncbi:hypothetical protein DYB32_008984 [Aphanomyces invadans]|uniref:Protein kinase domain-containing protein n=1 Tax=Aphanomyces invadans TaxID=157072 RepID=A0A418AJL9_9STRA|nr:hypothetical protein DYB32_008984 [Aphanomyces invadans]